MCWRENTPQKPQNKNQCLFSHAVTDFSRVGFDYWFSWLFNDIVAIPIVIVVDIVVVFGEGVGVRYG